MERTMTCWTPVAMMAHHIIVANVMPIERQTGFKDAGYDGLTKYFNRIEERNKMTKTVICKDVFGNEYETPIDDLDVRIGVYAVIIRDNKILLARQWEGYSEAIGGGVEKGRLLKGICAKTEEETGLRATPGKLIHHATTFFKRDEKSRSTPIISVLYHSSRYHW